MDTILTEEEKEFLKKIENQRIKHNLSQKKYREKHLQQVQEYNKKYNEDKKRKTAEIKQKLIKAEPPKTIELKEFTEKPKIDKRRRGGKKQAETIEIKPSYETRKNVLEYSTIDDYISKANILNKFFNKRDLPQAVKAELRKLLNDNSNIDEKLILDEMTYINNFEKTIKDLREKYQNDNSFKSYINVMAVITSHFKGLNSIYQVYTKIGKDTNSKVQDIREENELSEEDAKKIISLRKEDVKANINKLDTIEDKLLYALYTLTPARRLDYRTMILTDENDETKLNKNNYLILKSPKRFLFNDYKTYKTYGKQVFFIPNDLEDIINKYLNIKELKAGDIFIPLDRNKKEMINESNFSSKITNLFNNIYGIPIPVRFIRMSWASWLYAQNPSVKFIKEITNMMSHSVDESRKYNKLFNKNKK